MENGNTAQKADVVAPEASDTGAGRERSESVVIRGFEQLDRAAAALPVSAFGIENLEPERRRQFESVLTELRDRFKLDHG